MKLTLPPTVEISTLHLYLRPHCQICTRLIRLIENHLHHLVSIVEGPLCSIITLTINQ